jgi:hypothetical protein
MAFKNLFKPSWKNSDITKREKAVKQLTNRDKLVDVLLNDENLEIRLIAWDKITGTLNRKQLINKIDNKEILQYIVKNEEKDNIRLDAAKKLGDEKQIKEVSLKIEKIKIGEELRNNQSNLEKNKSEIRNNFINSIGSEFCFYGRELNDAIDYSLSTIPKNNIENNFCKSLLKDKQFLHELTLDIQKVDSKFKELNIEIVKFRTKSSS